MKANVTRTMKIVMWPFIIMSRIQVTPRPSEVAEHRQKGPTEELPVSQNILLPIGNRFKRSSHEAIILVHDSVVVVVQSISRVHLFVTPWTVCSPLGSSVHGISQARILEWVAISFSRGSSQSRDRTCISCIDRQILYSWATWEAPVNDSSIPHFISLGKLKGLKVTQSEEGHRRKSNLI